MTIAENIRLEQEMSIIRDPLDQTKQMAVNADGSISVSPATNSVQVVSGAAAVGLVPANPPVGVSGVDGSGLKRALLTDAIGQMMTSEQDSEVFTASVSAASVLFTVNMTNWRSVLLQVTSAGSSCTVLYECSNDQSSWSVVGGTVAAASNTGSSFIGSSTTLNAAAFCKRAKYFRARVSVYGSGTVSVAYALSLQDVTPVVAAYTWGQAGEGSAVAGNPVTISVECRTTRKTAVANGSVVRPIGTVDGRLIVRPHSIPENEWKYAAAAGGSLNNSNTSATIAGAGGAGLSVYITGMQLFSEALTNATELVIRDGASGTVVWRHKISSSGMTLVNIAFQDPIKGTANTLMEVATLTAVGTGSIYVNAQGYYAP